ncbi:MAG: SPL family radical SAM protein [Huintestinicola sp.]
MEKISAKTILSKNKSGGWFGTDYTMNLYRGCCHGCIYCDSRSSCYKNEDFDTVKVKENCLQILRDELRRKVRSGIIGTGSMSDPYNPFEETELYTRHALELIDAFEFGCVILTKSAMITRDIDLFCGIREHSPMMCKLTITTADDKLCRLIEPNVSTSTERFEALAQMADSGLFTGITMMPILPFLEDNEENIRKIVRYGHETGVRFIYPALGMTLRDNQRDYYLAQLDKLFPEEHLSEKYLKRFGMSYECHAEDTGTLWKVFTSECEKYGILYHMKDIISAYKTGYENTQLSFF